MGTCFMHEPPESVPDAELLDHMRVVHPEQWDQVERWPDGGLVVADHSLEPDDFARESGDR